MENVREVATALHKTIGITHKAAEITLHVGEDVLLLLQEEEFQCGWDALYEACPWATAFQSRAFVATWYRLYQKMYLPILVKCVEDGRLTGLLTIARDHNGFISGAGSGQAEYQVWLATDFNGEDFIKEAIIAIRKDFGNCLIQFKYIPARAPMKWAERDATWKKHCIVRTARQPLLRIDEAKIAGELRKKNRREKLNRLKRIGEVKFEHITDNKVFASLFDELIHQYDFRQGARFNKSFFQSDPLRRTFLLSLFEQRLLHATVLRLDERIIASNVGVTGKEWVHLQGVNTHAPCYARYSPGILHFLMLGKQLAIEGVEFFDLTPGKDSYKEDLASDFNEVYELAISGAPSRYVKSVKLGIVDTLKKSLTGSESNQAFVKKLRKDATILKEKIQNIKAQGPLSLVRNIFRVATEPGKTREYVAPPGSLMDSAGLAANRDSLGDLLDFEARGTWMSRWEFLEDAMHRFEVGQHAYTWSEGGRLLGCAWLCSPKAAAAGGAASDSVAEGSVVLQGFYCHPAGRGRLEAFVRSVAAAAAKESKEGQVYALAKDNLFSRALVAAGFSLND